MKTKLIDRILAKVGLTRISRIPSEDLRKYFSEEFVSFLGSNGTPQQAKAREKIEIAARRRLPRNGSTIHMPDVMIPRAHGDLPPFPYHGQCRIEECRVNREGVRYNQKTFFDPKLQSWIGEPVMVVPLAIGTVGVFTLDEKPICEAKPVVFEEHDSLASGGNHV